MTNYTSSSGWYSLSLPGDWTAERNGNLVTFYHPNAVSEGWGGALQLSAFSVPEHAEVDLATEFTKYLQGKISGITNQDIQSEKTGEYETASFGFFGKEDGRYWVFWMLSKTPRLILASYNCPADSAGKEKADVESIIASLNIQA